MTRTVPELDRRSTTPRSKQIRSLAQRMQPKVAASVQCVERFVVTILGRVIFQLRDLPIWLSALFFKLFEPRLRRNQVVFRMGVADLRNPRKYMSNWTHPWLLVVSVECQGNLLLVCFAAHFDCQCNDFACLGVEVKHSRYEVFHLDILNLIVAKEESNTKDNAKPRAKVFQ